jgi:23S rRNA pseudouridine2605 synthase
VSEERLQKILARAGVASRRKAEELIREGRVTVNGQVAAIGAKADPQRDSVKLDERRIHAPAGHRYLLLNKPRGVLSTVSDPAGRPTVVDLVPPALRRALAPVGRLDFQTEGLLLLTDDGELAQHVAHPSFGCWKTYEVKVRGRPDAEQLDRLRAGIVLEGRRTAPCRIAVLRRPSRAAPAAPRRAGGRRGVVASASSWWSVELGEGRSRQLREMFQRIGHPVQKLRRIAIGPVSDPDLPVGSLRELTEREVAALRRSGPPAAPRKPPRAVRDPEKAARETSSPPNARAAAAAEAGRPLTGGEGGAPPRPVRGGGRAVAAGKPSHAGPRSRRPPSPAPRRSPSRPGKGRFASAGRAGAPSPRRAGSPGPLRPTGKRAAAPGPRRAGAPGPRRRPTGKRAGSPPSRRGGSPPGRRPGPGRPAGGSTSRRRRG